MFFDFGSEVNSNGNVEIEGNRLVVSDLLHSQLIDVWVYISINIQFDRNTRKADVTFYKNGLSVVRKANASLYIWDNFQASSLCEGSNGLDYFKALSGVYFYPIGS